MLNCIMTCFERELSLFWFHQNINNVIPKDTWDLGTFYVISELIVCFTEFWFHLRVDGWKEFHTCPNNKKPINLQNHSALEPIQVLTSKATYKVESDEIWSEPEWDKTQALTHLHQNSERK